MRVHFSHAPWFAVALLFAGLVSAADKNVDLSKEKTGQEPASFQPIVGTWAVTEDGREKVILVDGRPWMASQNNHTALLAEKARLFYGASHEDFIDNVKQFAYFPIALLKGVDDFSSGVISMKFKTVNGQLDRCSGILFNVKQNGDWLSVRYNDTENNIALWRFQEGRRRSVKRGPEGKWMLDRSQWHELKMSVEKTDFKAWIDGQLALEHTLAAPVSGRVGLWSKTDSTSYFKDYLVSSK